MSDLIALLERQVVAAGGNRLVPVQNGWRLSEEWYCRARFAIERTALKVTVL